MWVTEEGSAWCWDEVLLSYTGWSGRASLIRDLKRVKELAMWILREELSRQREGQVQRTGSRTTAGGLQEQQRPVCSGGRGKGVGQR